MVRFIETVCTAIFTMMCAVILTGIIGLANKNEWATEKVTNVVSVFNQPLEMRHGNICNRR